MADRTNKEIKTGRFIATASIAFSILLIIHYFVSLDNATAKALLNLTNQNTSDKAIDYILNSFQIHWYYVYFGLSSRLHHFLESTYLCVVVYVCSLCIK